MIYSNTTAILGHLSERDRAILADIEKFRLLTTRHIQQLHFRVAHDGHLTGGAATKATMRVLTRLHQHRVIDHLERRIGGVRHGSQGYIWQLTSTGDHLLRHLRGEPGRTRYIEPSRLFTEHTLAIADLAVALHAAAGHAALELLELETEPNCWREYVGPHGIPEILKPDLFAVTATGEFEDHWFIEADQGTEHLPQILTKCAGYTRYEASGIEQHRTGVFPAVLWVANTPERAAAIARAIRQDETLPDDLFQTTSADRFADYLVTVKDSS